MMARRQAIAPALLLVAAAGLVCLLQPAAALVTLPPLTPYGPVFQPPVTNWLLSKDIPAADQLAWRKIGSKIWTFMTRLDHDFVDATGQTVPPGLATQRLFGPAVKCGRFSRIFIRMPFHDCGTFDVGGTGSFGDTGRPRFGCNGSLRWELAPCEAGAPRCVNGFEAAIDLATGAFLPEGAFDSVTALYGPGVQVGFDAANPRFENSGFQNALAFLYQVKFETEALTEPAATRLAHVSLADLIVYAGFLATAHCKGPQIEFLPGRTDSAEFDGPQRLPDPKEPLSFNIAYFWTNGLTNFDMVNLLAAHTTGCFSFGCMDTTPSLFDNDWARQVLSITSAADPKICQVPAEGLPPPPPVNLCVLPADAVFNARQDIRNYLLAHINQMSIATAAAVFNPCTLEPGLDPAVVGTCDVGPGGVPFVPFRFARTAGGSVNLCSRNYQNFFFETAGCISRTSPLKTSHDLFATSYFKLTKLYVDATGAVAGTPWGVARQPCTDFVVEEPEVPEPVRKGHKATSMWQLVGGDS